MSFTADVGHSRGAPCAPQRHQMSEPDEEPEFDHGTPGASARREGERRRANRERRTREQHPLIGGFLLAIQEQPRHESVWARGAGGEELVAQRLTKHLDSGVELLSDRRIPRSRANIDFIAVASSGVWVIDAKRYKGKVSISKPLFGEARLIIGGRNQTKLIAGLARQVAVVEAAMPAIAPGVPVRGALCFADADLPTFGKLSFSGYSLLYPKALAKRINAEGPVTAEGVREVAARLAQQFPSV
jgi:hypothetical protein